MLGANPIPNRNGKSPIKIVCHSRTVLKLAERAGWLAGASYVRLRDIRGIKTVGLIDIDWKNYDFKKHLQAVKTHRPLMTVAKDVTCVDDLNLILDQAYELLEWTQFVIIVPKDPRLSTELAHIIPNVFILGYSVPTKFGGTCIPLEHFRGRRVHLLGGRPDVQRKIARSLNVISLDVNRFTLDARYGDFFDGEIFRPHPIGGYHRCLQDSICNIETLWSDYGHEYQPAVSYQEGSDNRPSAGKKVGRRKL